MTALPVRKSLPHEIPHWIDPSAEIYFITVNCKDRNINALCTSENGDLLLESVEFRHHSREWFVHLFLLMPDHVHGLISFSTETHSIQKSLSNWKTWTSRQAGIRWQRDFFEHRLRGSERLEQKADYIRENPVRAGLVRNSDEWPWVLRADLNSGRLYRGGSR